MLSTSLIAPAGSHRRVGLWLTGAVAVVVLVAVLALHNVPRTVTAEDRLHLAQIMARAGYEWPLDIAGFDDQIAAIRSVQAAVFSNSPLLHGIPARESREPRDLYRLQQALCFDRARTLDKAFRTLGIESRYAYVFAGGGLLAPDLDSHAVVEVRTDKGWLVVDTRHLWLSLRANGEPVGLADLRTAAHEWMSGTPYPLLEDDFRIVYGLYSRHGQFYPPYTRVIPDVNWLELLHNWRA